MSSHDLVGANGDFLLLFGSAAPAWEAAAHAASAALGITLRPVAIGAGGACDDADGQWAAVSELEPTGAVLVRPDNHVAWRSQGGGSSAQAELASVLRRLLGR